MLTLKPMPWEELALAWDSMRREFPDDERKPLEMLQKQTRQGMMEPWWLMEDGVPKGYAMMLTAPECPMALLDYLAMLDKDRGYGTACLNLLRKQYPGGILVEAEAEQPGLEPDEAAHRARRLRFYTRSGFCTLHWQAEVFGVVYQLLFWSEGEDSEKSCAACYRRIYENQLPAQWMQAHFSLQKEELE